MIVGIGIDAVDLDRFERSLDRYGKRILERLYTPYEQEYCEVFSSPLEHYAVRFAAKEAFLKAIGTGKAAHIRWRDIEILNEDSGKPYMRIHDSAEEKCSSLGGKHLHVSLSHSRMVAIAVVVLEG